jgi:SulP family sulfate permease
MLIVYLFPRITKAIPSTLVALVLVTILSLIFSADVAIIGDIPSGLPMFHYDIFTAIDDLNIILMPAVTLAALGAIDSLLTSVVADNVTRTSHDSNKELIGQGFGNIVGGFIGGIPGAGATMRTLVNINSGGTTKASGVIHGIFLLFVLLGLSTLASLIPIPVLAGILLTVGISIVDRRGLSHIGKITKTDAIVLIIVLILTVFVDLLQAVAAGMIISSVIFIKQMGDITQKDSTPTTIQTSKEAEQLHERYHILKSIRPYVSIKRINGPLFFGNSEYFMQLSKKVADEIKLLIIDMKHVPYIDQSGLYSLESIILNLEQKGVQVYLLNLQKQPEAMMRNILLIPNIVEPNTIFDDEILCAETAKIYIEQIFNEQKK